jgi:hypothetical protein
MAPPRREEFHDQLGRYARAAHDRFSSQDVGIHDDAIGQGDGEFELWRVYSFARAQ